MIVQDLKRLAVFGGRPAFEEQLHVGRPNLGSRERLLRRVDDILDRRWLTNDGPYVRQFERSVAELTGTRHCVAMCNGTIALEIMIRAAGLGGQVIVPAFTFVATAHALQWQEIQPVFCDVDPRSHNIDPARVDELVTPRTTGVIGVHLWGRGCDVEGLEEVARRRGLQLFFDASHALGCSHGGKVIGGFGRAEVLSFHATKSCNSFEGGAVVTNDDELAQKLRLMRNFGFAGKDRVIYIGSNGKMSEVCAAMGLTSLESHHEFVAASRSNYERYRQRLERIPGLSLIDYDERERSNYHYVVLEVDRESAGIDRDLLIRVLEAENVLARRYFFPGVHRMEPYRSFQPQAGLVLPVTERLAQRVMQLPTGSSIDTGQVDRICDLLEIACANGERIRRQLATDGAAGGAR